MFGDELKKYLKEEDFKISWYFWRRASVNFYKDADILLKRDKINGKFVILFKELVNIE